MVVMRMRMRAMRCPAAQPPLLASARPKRSSSIDHHLGRLEDCLPPVYPDYTLDVRSSRSTEPSPTLDVATSRVEMRRCLQHCQPPLFVTFSMDWSKTWFIAHLASCKHHTGEEEEKEEKEEREGREKEEREGEEEA